MSAVLPSRGSKTFRDLQLTQPALPLPTRKWPFWGGDSFLFLDNPVSQLPPNACRAFGSVEWAWLNAFK